LDPKVPVVALVLPKWDGTKPANQTGIEAQVQLGGGLQTGRIA
jgi:hypothetical protein